MTPWETIFADFRSGRLDSFYKRIYPQLLLFATDFLGSEFSFLAEDFVQDAVYKSYEKRREFASMQQWRLFLYTCIRNASVSAFRKKNAQDRFTYEMDMSDDTLDLNIIEQETLSLLHEAINSLPEKYAILFRLSYVEGLKNGEIADILKVSEITVKKQKARLLELLRTNFKQFVWLILFI